MRQSYRDIDEDDFDEDDMPCPCEVCHEWFDLNDGKEHPRKDNLVICVPCANAIQVEVDREEEIQDLLSQISDAEDTLKECRQRLAELNYNPEKDI